MPIANFECFLTRFFAYIQVCTVSTYFLATIDPSKFDLHQDLKASAQM
jgi:hypothetical protein